MFFDTKDPYDYMRVDRHEDSDYVIFGGEDHKTGQVDAEDNCFNKLLIRLRRILPDAQIENRWSGQVIETNDGLAFHRRKCRAAIHRTGFCGNGITFGTVSAMMARDWATGSEESVGRFVFARTQNRSWRSVGLSAGEQGLSLLSDQRSPRPRGSGFGARAETQRTGMIVKSKHGKVAAYRDAEGEVHKRSAVCPHMGCIVRWNDAEKTWDCPCHGSRFKPTGEVIAGPAEVPLPPL